jgi:hypothetical protein
MDVGRSTPAAWLFFVSTLISLMHWLTFGKLYFETSNNERAQRMKCMDFLML